MHNWELEMLRREYAIAATDTDKLIQLELEGIIKLQNECKGQEFVFANAIASRFCQIIRMMKQQQEKQEVAEPNRQNYVSYRAGQLREQTADQLLCGFYNRFRNETKIKTGKPADYPPIQELSQLKTVAANATIKDYVSRIRTFTNRYLWEIPRVLEIWKEEYRSGMEDPVLFTYKYLELILASFETKDGDAQNKQKNNIRSALRKLNEFKQERDAQ